MVNMWRRAVVFVAISSVATLPSGAAAEEDCAGGAVRCGDGSCAGADLVCDGTPDCADGADEALELCRRSGRPLFALILLCQQPWSPLHDALCPEVCREWPKFCYYAISAEHGAPGTCVLPQSSKRGAYRIVDVEPRGRGPADFSLAFACPRGYRLQGEQPRCVRGTWTSDFPACVTTAMFPAASVATDTDLTKSNSCVTPESPENGNYVVRSTYYERLGRVTTSTTLTVHCNPGYTGFGSSSYCKSKIWIPEVLPKCTECGVLRPSEEPLVIGGQARVHSQIPWHAVIYDKSSSPYRQICGGSLVSTSVVISAAHCFWAWADDKLRPAENYAVAVGKVYRSWGRALPRGTQTSVQSSDVRELKIPVGFMGHYSTFFKNDIALVILATPVVFDTFVQPVCLDFHVGYSNSPLGMGNIGKILSWASEKEDQPPSNILSLRSLPFVSLETCITNSNDSFRQYITIDKFCAGSQQASPALGAVYTARAHSCSGSEFQCADGACVSRDRRCDGAADCADGSDERACQTSSNQLDLNDLVLNRYKRQSGCRKNQFRCRDGTCIRFDGKCDGVFNCPDQSDETHALCRKMSCPENLFRCTYGACVDGTAPCNGVQECADNSDELLPRCRNATQPVRSQFRCDDGEVIKSTDHCDGKADCADGSDETIASCAGKRCPSYYFQCAYGACVDSGANCDGKQDCVDNSDESDELCNRTTSVTTTTTRPIENVCVLPAFPEHGVYSVEGEETAVPGQTRSTASFIVSCKTGYGVIGNNRTGCYYGAWQAPMPQCSRFCKLTPHPSVDYYCNPTEQGVIGGRRLCHEYEPENTEVFPSCKRPNYYEKIINNRMLCKEGSWDHTAICYPECGTLTAKGDVLVSGGDRVQTGELPWHAGIYETASTPYSQTCGGSLVTNTVVISAAHCFWKGGYQHGPEKFAVALGKIYRPWANPQDKGAQMSNVSHLRISQHYRGSESHYQADIALVFLSTPITFTVSIRPVCLDFDDQFDDLQLRNGQLGKVAGWGRTGADEGPSKKLLAVNMPFVDTGTCEAEMPHDFRAYLTADKFCAGYRNGSTVCEGDSGGGLAFPSNDRSALRYYLRGIVSTAPASTDHQCNLDVYVTFTKIHNYESFIKEELRGQIY